jgi:hypothetical protein
VESIKNDFLRFPRPWKVIIIELMTLPHWGEEEGGSDSKTTDYVESFVANSSMGIGLLIMEALYLLYA